MNLVPLDYESIALPTELIWQIQNWAKKFDICINLYKKIFYISWVSEVLRR